MSTQLNTFLDVARGEEGFIEGPAENQTHYQKANQPWCGAFVNWCAKKSKVTSIPNCTFTPSGAEAFQAKGKWEDAEVASPMPGDIVFFDFPSDNVDRISHVGIVLQVRDDGTVVTIEGNTTPDKKKGDQRNGGQVCRKVRAYKKKNRGKLQPSLPVFIVGFGKPTFKE